MVEKSYFKIDGLDCAEEVAVLKKEIGTKQGIIELDFDILNARMAVSYDPQIISRQEIISSVNSTGMKAIPWQQRTEKPHTSFWWRKGRLITTCLSGALLLTGFASHWFIHRSFFHAIAPDYKGEEMIFPLVSIIFYVSAVVTGLLFIAPKALRALMRFRADMNLLMTVAVFGAIIIGEWFEAATITFLFAVAELLEQWSITRARRAIETLLDLSPPTARVKFPDGSSLEKPIEDVPVGSIVIVLAGEKIPLDGKIKTGVSAINQAPITGESIPVTKEPGDVIYAGTINGDSVLEFETSKPANDTALVRIIHMVEQAQSRRAQTEQWIEKFAHYYTPAMMVLALAFGVVPPLIVGGWMEWFYRGLVMLVIACPCALVISTPVSIVSGLTSAARNGVLIKGGVYLETIGNLKALALDKTGTLTYGKPQVQQIVPFNEHSEKELLEIAAALEANSEHPLAKAVIEKARVNGIRAEPATDFSATKGKGATAKIEGRPYWIGSHRLMDEQGQETQDVHNKAESLEDSGHSVIAIGNEKHVCGLIGVADTLREDIPQIIKAIKNSGVEHITMLTGDNKGTASAIARMAGVDEYKAELLPEDKVNIVDSLVAKFGCAAMIGDGINDAPALAAATVGIAMGAVGSDAAIETADIALMSDELSKLPWLLNHSKRTLGIIKANIIFSLGVKFVFIVLAVLGLASLWMAIAADMGASLLVIFNSLRLLRSH